MNAVKIIFKKGVRNRLQTDYGKEFYISKMKLLLSKYKIHHFSSHSSLKASVVERFNRTLKEKMWKYFSEVNNHCWIDVIDKFMINYYNSFHRSIKMTPIGESNKKKRKQSKKKLITDIKRVENINIGLNI